jgi:hypothetical protein
MKPSPSASPIVNNTNSTDLGIENPEIGALMNAATFDIANNPAALGGIGVAAVVAIIGVIAAYSFFGKKAPPKKAKKASEPFSELSTIAQPSPLQNKVNSIKMPTQVQRIQISSLNTTTLREGIANPLVPGAHTKVAFNPVTAAAKAAASVNVNRAVQQAVPLEMYRAHNVNLDRMSVKRPIKTNVKMPSVVESRVGFQPVKKEWKPQFSKNAQVSQGARKAETEHLNIAFNK